ncbi:unnamed protein product [Vitrella brassicaformis CCMP3155]|uniref:F-box domain-containing protein n=1 Tax=Vitrella brassicaformis (strain CCMP3155) TaxID=1169540 RepID=A0A0G4GMS8_VITBC|nr:unnamed protein product [Vitrella brassicaformis CCMP3155]|eukprot:CEM31506.1 unnamed protein product [Vitrella brassicaformis CCMP3155]
MESTKRGRGASFTDPSTTDLPHRASRRRMPRGDEGERAARGTASLACGGCGGTPSTSSATPVEGHHPPSVGGSSGVDDSPMRNIVEEVAMLHLSPVREGLADDGRWADQPQPPPPPAGASAAGPSEKARPCASASSAPCRGWQCPPSSSASSSAPGWSSGAVGRHGENEEGQLPFEILFLVCFFLDGKGLACFGTVSSLWQSVSGVHPSWQELVLKDFGFKYENLVMYTGQNDWRLLYARVAGFIANLRNGTPVKTVWPQLLEPLTGVDYEGAVAMSADTSLLLWENGRVLQVVDMEEGRTLFTKEIDPEQYPRNRETRPCIVNTKTRAFVHLNGDILVYDLRTGEFVRKLEIPDGTQLESNDFALDISIRNDQVAFLAIDALYMWNSETLEFLYKIRHGEKVNGPNHFTQNMSEELDFLWAGYQWVDDDSLAGAAAFEDPEVRQPQRLCRKSANVVTWLKRAGYEICIFDIASGRLLQNLKGHTHEVVRVRQTPNPYDSNEYFLASLDTLGTVCVWDSSGETFPCVYVLKTNNSLSFRLCLTPSHLITLSENTHGDAAPEQVELKIWKFDPPRPKRRLQRFRKGGPSLPPVTPRRAPLSSKALADMPLEDPPCSRYAPPSNVVSSASRQFFANPLSAMEAATIAREDRRKGHKATTKDGRGSGAASSFIEKVKAGLRKVDRPVTREGGMVGGGGPTVAGSTATRVVSRQPSISMTRTCTAMSDDNESDSAPMTPRFGEEGDGDGDGDDHMEDDAHPPPRAMSSRSSTRDEELPPLHVSLPPMPPGGGCVFPGGSPSDESSPSSVARFPQHRGPPRRVWQKRQRKQPDSLPKKDVKDASGSGSSGKATRPVLYDLRTTELRNDVYFADVIDNQILGVWYSTSRPGSAEPWSLSHSDWEVYTVLSDADVAAMDREHEQMRRNLEEAFVLSERYPPQTPPRPFRRSTPSSLVRTHTHRFFNPALLTPPDHGLARHRGPFRGANRVSPPMPPVLQYFQSYYGSRVSPHTRAAPPQRHRLAPQPSSGGVFSPSIGRRDAHAFLALQRSMTTPPSQFPSVMSMSPSASVTSSQGGPPLPFPPELPQPPVAPPYSPVPPRHSHRPVPLPSSLIGIPRPIPPPPSLAITPMDGASPVGSPLSHACAAGSSIATTPDAMRPMASPAMEQSTTAAAASASASAGVGEMGASSSSSSSSSSVGVGVGVGVEVEVQTDPAELVLTSPLVRRRLMQRLRHLQQQDDGANEPVGHLYLDNRRAFEMRNRADTWSLLDWKSVSIEDDGTLVIYDFCPISEDPWRKRQERSKPHQPAAVTQAAPS